MSRDYQIPKKYLHARKYGGKCEKCGEVTPENKIYQYIDGDNMAITHNSPYLCESCYKEQMK